MYVRQKEEDNTIDALLKVSVQSVIFEYCFLISVLPVPAYPVVNGNTDRDRTIVISSSGKSSFRCTMEHVRPAVPLEVVFVSPVSDYISVKTNPTTLNNTDGTFTVSLDTQLNIGIDLPIGIYSLQCAVAKSFKYLFTSVATIELVVLGKFHRV